MVEVELNFSREKYAARLAKARAAMSLRAGDRSPLEPGMTFHLMSGLWMEDWGFETTESIVITERGADCLADVPRKLFVKE